MSGTAARTRLKQFTEEVMTLANELERARNQGRRGRK